MVQKPKGPNTYDLKFLLQPSGNQGTYNNSLTYTEYFPAKVSLSRINFRHTLYGYFYAKVIHGQQNMNTCKRRNKFIIGVKSSLLTVTQVTVTPITVTQYSYTDSFPQNESFYTGTFP